MTFFRCSEASILETPDDTVRPAPNPCQEACEKGYYLNHEICKCYRICYQVKDCDEGFGFDAINCGCVVRVS